ncbi:hypothetical protein FRC04_004478 [Tulasnella sp. 424]|nr:hypothetical protein FRC04_004478 [Tulasnella sp. 424]KAG8976547.1 hypothetical protein FRC05_003386 [Tulasnella sp. 425]
MPALSADASSETNALLRLLVMKVGNTTLTPSGLSPAFTPDSRSVLENCLLYSSLCCSLLAAVGAMLGKEWLQSFDRSGQAGPLEQQGRFRQRKYNGVQQWHLETIILFLPNILLLSVLLFFNGLALFLFSVNKAVAAVVIAFMVLGAILSSATYVAGATSSLCPYQTAVSRAIRQAWRSATQYREVMPTIYKDLINAVGSRLRPLSRTLGELNTALQRRFFSNRTQLISGQGSSSGHIGTPLLRVVATAWGHVEHFAGPTLGRWKQNILDHMKPINGKDQRPDKGLSESDEEHLINARAACWLFEMTSSLSDQVIVAQNICSLNEAGCALVLSELDMWRRLLYLTFEALQAWRDQPMAENKRIAHHFACALYHLLRDVPRDDNKWKDVETTLPRELFRSGSFELKELGFVLTRQQLSIALPESTEYSLKTIVLHSMIINDNVEPFLRHSHLLQTQYDDTILSLLALGLQRCSARRQTAPMTPPPSYETSAQGAYSGKNLAQNLAAALTCSPEISDLAACDSVYTVFLRRINNLFSRGGMDPTVQGICKGAVLDFIVTLGPRTDDNILKFPVEAILVAKSLFGKPNERWNERITEGFWCALEHVDALPSSEPSRAMQRSGVRADFFSETLKWGLCRMPPGSHLASLKGHPNILKYIRQHLIHELPRLNGRWHKLLEMYQAQLFQVQANQLLDLWLEAGWCIYLVQRLQQFSQHANFAELDLTMDLIDSTIYYSTRWALKFVDEGFVDAAAEIIIALSAELDSNGDQLSLRTRFLKLVRFVRSNTEGSLEDKWRTDKMLDVGRCLSTHSNWAPIFQTGDASFLAPSLVTNQGSTDSSFDGLLGTAEEIRQIGSESVTIGLPSHDP